jgi:hypothetical protein
MPADSHMAEPWDVAVKVDHIEIGLECSVAEDEVGAA